MGFRWFCTLSPGLLFVLLAAIGCGGGSISSTTPTNPSSPSPPATPSAAAPAITSVTPATVAAGAPAFTLQINGTGFVSGSVISWNGAALTTTYVSATELNAAVPASLAAKGGSFAITVANPDGQTSGTSGPKVAVDNPKPAITTLSPSSVYAGTGALNVMVTGTGFVPGSAASFAGNTRPTTVQSATQLTVALTEMDLAAAGQANVTVTNPSPGGGTSAPALFTVTLPLQLPTITGITPDSLIAPAPSTQITITGSGFTSQSFVLIGGLQFRPDSIAPTRILVTIQSYYLYAPALENVIVEDSGYRSNAVVLSVLNPLPVIQSISNQTVTAGTPSFSITIQATGMVTTTQINVNGAPLAAPFSSFDNVVTIPASALAQVGTITFSLTNPGPGGGTSNTATLHVIAGNNYLRTVNLPANALVWNPSQQVIYAAVPASASSNASSIVAIDPASGNVVASQPMPAEPSLLAISDDQQYLYAGMTATATIVRLKLPALTTDIQWTVGPTPASNYPYSLYNMQVAPGTPHTLAVTQETPALGQTIELAVYDDGVMRPNIGTGTNQPIGDTNVFQWGADASTIYATEDAESGGPEFIYAVNAQGVTLTGTNQGAFANFSNELLYDSREARLYDPGGDVIDPPTGKVLGSFPSGSNSFTIDSAQRRVYFLGGTPYPDGVNLAQYNPVAQISVFDQDHFTLEGTMVVPQVSSTAGPVYGGPNLVRWGSAGLAFNAGSSIYILDGPFVTPGAPPSSTAGTYLDAPPQLTGLSPESVVAGSPDVTLTLTGQNFTPATSVSWLNNVLATTFVSNTEVQAVIPAAAITAPVAAPLYVSNSPGEGISNILAFSVLPSLGTGMQLTALNLSGSDLVWNAAAQKLYVAVVNTDSLRPQTIATVDPVAGAVESTLPLSANPYVLSISADDQYLYTGFTNNANVQRYTLPALTPDLLIPLGVGDGVYSVEYSIVRGGVLSCDFAVSMAVAPGTNTTIAVTQGNSGIEVVGCGATAVFDGAIARPVTPAIYTSSGHDFSRLTWGADTTALYAQGDDCCSSQPISSLTVSNTGVVFDQSNTSDIYLGYRLHFDAGTDLLYSDGGAVTQPSTLAMVGNFNASGLVVTDSTLGLAYFLGQTPSQIGGNYGQGTVDYTLQIFNLKTYALLGSIVIPNIIGFPNQMVRWGAAGIAFTTENGDYAGNSAPGLTYLLSGPAIASPAAQEKPAGAEHVQFTWKSQLQKRRSAKSR
jgi:IPT/TIG domain